MPNPNDLIVLHPELYSKLDRREIECSSGWYELLRELSGDLVAVDPNLRAVQVKSKFGSLSFYTDHVPNVAASVAIQAATEKSRITCERCGDPAKTRIDKGRYSTRCERCSGT
jgi:hypothetical protein